MKTLFTNAVIYSPNRLKADCIAVDQGRIVDIGLKNKLISLNRHGFKQIDLKGKAVLPGFIDSHLHLISTGYGLMSIDLDYIDSAEKVLAKIQKAAQKISVGQWLIGRGWNKNLWGDEFPTKEMLDSVVPSNPVRLFSKDGHSLWVNSKALKVCGIDDTISDPDGGSILRKQDGGISGVFLENAVELIVDKIPEPSAEYKLKAVKKAVKYLNGLGITGVGDCDWNQNRLSLFSIARDRGFMSLRVLMMLSPDDINAAARLGLRTGFGDDFITAGPLKLFMDGALCSQTALMHEPYENNPGNYGIATMSEDELEMHFEKTHLNGISLAVHAIGDRAVTELLDFFGKKYAISKKLGLKHRMEHAQIVRKDDIPRFKRYDVAASVQPIHILADRDTADRYWGKRSRWAYPFKSMIGKGARLGFGSDSPIEDPNPILGIYAAIARKRPGDSRDPWYGEESITLNEAVNAYTGGAAEICTWAGRSGEISVGAKADFVVLSDDIYRVKTEQIPDLKVLATIVNGDIACQDKAFKL